MVRIIWMGIKADNLTTHQLDKHVEGGRLEVPTWSVGEVLQDVLQAFGLMPKILLQGVPGRCLQP